MITLDSHEQRKALGLTLNEMAVLSEIYNSLEYTPFGENYSSIKKSVLSERLDLTPKSIFNILNTLENLGYINRIRQQSKIQITDLVYSIK